jgi:hypothetical protein
MVIHRNGICHHGPWLVYASGSLSDSSLVLRWCSMWMKPIIGNEA